MSTAIPLGHPQSGSGLSLRACGQPAPGTPRTPAGLGASGLCLPATVLPLHRGRGPGPWDSPGTPSAEEHGEWGTLEAGPRPLRCQCLLGPGSLTPRLLGQRGQMWGGEEQNRRQSIVFSLSRSLECGFHGKARAAFFPLCPRVKGRSLSGRHQPPHKQKARNGAGHGFQPAQPCPRGAPQHEGAFSRPLTLLRSWRLFMEQNRIETRAQIFGTLKEGGTEGEAPGGFKYFF